MGATDRFSSEEVQRILGVTAKQLDQWGRLRLVSPRQEEDEPYYDFRDLIGLRTVKQLLESGVPANRLQRAVDALREKLSKVQAPLAELRVLSDGKDVVVERDGARLDPLSGQFVLNFEIREIGERVRVIAHRTADDWFNAALAYESSASTKAEASQAYDLAVQTDPRKVDALLNGGTLSYERGNLEKARQHLRHAVQLDPHYSDAHYNLAYVCEKLRAFPEAREHWQTYIQLDPAGPWTAYARSRLAALPTSIRSISNS